MSGDADDVVRFWERLGLPGIIDVHTHFMPERVLAKVWGYFDSAGPLTGMEWPIEYRHDEDERLALLRSFGVLRFTSMLYPHKAGMAAWLNGWAADFARRVPDCLHTATFFPEEGVAGYVREAVEAGARVFKSHLQVGAYDANDPLLEPVWGLLAEAGIPVVMHCGSGPAPGKYTGPEPVGRLLARHPRLPLIVAHMGMPEYAEFLALAETYPGCGSTRRWRSRTSRTTSPRSRRPSGGGSPRSGTGSCWARTSRTSRIRTRTNCTRWNGWSWGTTGCGRSVTGTRAPCSTPADGPSAVLLSQGIHRFG